jgi:sugar O-acyltransferase (sialic acid O-acetyltransferase NeuD family)
VKRLAILGASGHGKVVADAALESGWDDVVFFDDRWPSIEAVGDWIIVGDSRALLAALELTDGVIVGIGDCKVRHEKHSLLAGRGARIPVVKHPAAWVSSRSRVGAGSVIMAGAVVNIDAALGDACIVNTGSTIDHDCTVGRSVHVAPGAHLSGRVSVGDRSWIGVGACVRQGIRIGADAVIGAGAVVIKDVDDGTTVVGVPARPVHRRDDL